MIIENYHNFALYKTEKIWYSDVSYLGNSIDIENDFGIIKAQELLGGCL